MEFAISRCYVLVVVWNAGFHIGHQYQYLQYPINKVTPANKGCIAADISELPAKPSGSNQHHIIKDVF